MRTQACVYVCTKTNFTCGVVRAHIRVRVCVHVCVRTISHHIVRRFYNLICGDCTCRHACTFRSCSCRGNTSLCTRTPAPASHRRPIGGDRKNIEYKIMAGWQDVGARFPHYSTHTHTHPQYVFPHFAGACVRVSRLISNPHPLLLRFAWEPVRPTRKPDRKSETSRHGAQTTVHLPVMFDYLNTEAIHREQMPKPRHFIIFAE